MLPALAVSIAMTLALGTSGCFYHSAQIELVASSSISAGMADLSDAELDRAKMVVADVVSEYGLLPSTSDVERLSRTEDEWEDFILASYWTGEEAATDDRVVVSVKQGKETGRFSVLIRDLDSATASDFTVSLEEALSAALSEAFPSKTFQVERKTVGPALGP